MECIICLENISGEYYELDCCNTLYCVECLDAWKERNEVFTCPHCRREIDEDEEIIPSIPTVIRQQNNVIQNIEQDIVSIRNNNTEMVSRVNNNQRLTIQQIEKQERNTAILAFLFLCGIIYTLLVVKGPF